MSEGPDVCVIGLGAAGAVAAHVLAAAGARVLALEAGPTIDSGDARPDELLAPYALAGYGPKFN